MITTISLKKGIDNTFLELGAAEQWAGGALAYNITYNTQK